VPCVVPEASVDQQSVLLPAPAPAAAVEFTLASLSITRISPAGVMSLVCMVLSQDNAANGKLGIGGPL
jgi:hypothetical protein